MKFKYMIRGLGIGVIITAAVMGAYNRQAVADARVAVLKEYGLGGDSALMRETESGENVSSDNVNDNSEEFTEPVVERDADKESEISSVLDAAKESEQAQQNATDIENDIVPEMEETASEPSASVGPIVVAPTDENTGNGEPITSDVIQITISKGDDSGTISRKLHNAGLIENAAEYDAYLMQHGYDKKLSTGVKEINATDNWQEIAEKLIRK